MRTRSWTVGLAGLLGMFCLVALTSPAEAAPKKKKPAPAAEAEAEAETETKADDKSVDDLMEESATRKSTPSSSSSDDEKPAADEEPVGEPDAWERPPPDEEKPKKVEAPKAVEVYGDGRRIEVGLTPGFGFVTGKADWATLDPYSLALGLRGGYELDSRIFLGGGFIYHLGTSDDLNVATPGAPTLTVVSARQNYMLAFVEAGYDLWLDKFMVRPSMWVGMGFAVVDPFLTTGAARTVSDFMFAPGLNLIWIFDGLYIGADGRYVIVTADGAQGLDFFGLIGLRFR